MKLSDIFGNILRTAFLLVLFLSAAFIYPAQVSAGGDDQFVAEIDAFAFNFPPTGWAMCNGQILPLNQNTALFSLLGTTYGGNGTTNFALPDLQGRVPIQAGQGPGLSPYDLGQTSGSPTITLLQSEMPSHTHAYTYTTEPGNLAAPISGKSFAQVSTSDRKEINVYNSNPNSTLTYIGSYQPHNNMQPYLVVNYCIALQGNYPPHN